MARELKPDKLFLVCVIAEAAVIDEARKQSARFLNNESPRNRDTPDAMLPTPLSPSGLQPATHYLCTRKMTMPEIQRQAVAIASYPVPVVHNVVESEAEFLASQGLKRIES